MCILQKNRTVRPTSLSLYAIGTLKVIHQSATNISVTEAQVMMFLKDLGPRLGISNRLVNRKSEAFLENLCNYGS